MWGREGETVRGREELSSAPCALHREKLAKITSQSPSVQPHLWLSSSVLLPPSLPPSLPSSLPPSPSAPLAELLRLAAFSQPLLENLDVLQSLVLFPASQRESAGTKAQTANQQKTWHGQARVRVCSHHGLDRRSRQPPCGAFDKARMSPHAFDEDSV